jgi:hypothetical protein
MVNDCAQGQRASSLQAMVDSSSHKLIQQKRTLEVSKDAVQRQSNFEDEELLQGKMSPLQRQEDIEDEELLQGKMEIAQKQESLEDEELLQGKFAENQSTTQLQSELGQDENRTGLPDNLKTGIEGLSGLSMENVKVHYNSSKPAPLQALAYTQGTDIHVGPGQEKHLPHEAWHVVQQHEGRVKPTTKAKGVPVNDDHGLEHEADVMGEKALAHSAQLQSVSANQRPLQADHEPAQRKESDKLELRENYSGPKNLNGISQDFSAIVQRQLDVGNAIVNADVKTITKVDAKVWVLEGHHADRVVIKLENPVGGETQSEFAGRHEYVTWLAQQALEGVPDATELTPGELAVLTGLKKPEVGDGPTLKSFANQPHGLVFLKVAHVGMGAHLAKRFAEAEASLAKGGRGMMKKQTSLESLITNPVTLTALGRLAVFDLIVNNADRFRPNATVNEKNIDFNALNQLIAIDNLDPNNRIDANWPGRERVLDKGNRSGYSASVVSYLFEKIGRNAAEDAATMVPAILSFRAGMEMGAATCKALEAPLRAKAGADPDPHRQMLAGRIADRLNDLSL